MTDWPKLFHPARPDAAGDGLDVDLSVTVEVFQMQPGTWADLAVWCGGDQVLDDSGSQAVAVGDTVARLGDFVVRGAAAFQVEPADGFYQRYRPSEG